MVVQPSDFALLTDLGPQAPTGRGTDMDTYWGREVTPLV